MNGTMLIIELWNEELHGILSEESVRESLDNPRRFRISTNRYPRGTSFSGQSRLGTVYVVRGKCEYTHDSGKTTLSARDYCKIPEGNFRLEIKGDEDYEEVRVWPLPQAFWGQ